MGGLRKPLDGSANAKSKAETTAEGSNTHGVVNRHPAASHAQQDVSSAAKSSSGAASANALWPFKVGVSEDRNRRWRRTMEDAHAFVYDFGGVHGQGFFSVFDGHAGKHSAEWCGKHFHEYLVDALAKGQENGKPAPVPDVLNTTFHNVDARLFQLANEEKTSSGCTAVTCFLRLEDREGNPVAFASTGGVNPMAGEKLSGIGGAAGEVSNTPPPSKPTSLPPSSTENGGGTSPGKLGSSSSSSSSGGGGLFSSLARRIRKTSGGAEEEDEEQSKTATSVSKQQLTPTLSTAKTEAPDGLVKVTGDKIRRVLYTANVGDARAVLCRRGQAVRLTYDHKASDAQEAKRITDAGGFVMNNRVNAVLAVTRSLGDSAMKEFVVGAPYTTETTLTDDDTFLIVACDGLWDVVDDQDAVDLVVDIQDPVEMSQRLLQHALSNFSTDNTSVMVVRFRVDASGFPSTAVQRATSSEGRASSATTSSSILAEQGEDLSSSSRGESDSAASETIEDPSLTGRRNSGGGGSGSDAEATAEAAAAADDGGEGGSRPQSVPRRHREASSSPSSDPRGGVMTGYATTDSPETEPPGRHDSSISQRQEAAVAAQDESDRRKEPFIEQGEVKGKE